MLSELPADNHGSVVEVSTRYLFDVPITRVSYPANLFIESMVVMEEALNVPRALSQIGNSHWQLELNSSCP